MWKKEENDNERKLTEADRKDLVYYIFVGCILAISLSVIVNSVFLKLYDSKSSEETGKILDVIYAYMATATSDEYEQMAFEIRDEMVLHKYEERKWDYIKLIPNTVENCRLDMKSFPAQAYLLFVNNGQLYSIDIFQDGYDGKNKSGDGSMLKWGYDTVSETSIQTMTDQESKTGEIIIEGEQGIVSVHRMKKLFCDKCIKTILEVNQNSFILEAIIFDSKTHTLYPVEAGAKYQIGNYILDVEMIECRSYRIDVTYTD